MKTKRARSKRSNAELRRILVPIDFSSASDHALRFAVPLARQLGAKIDLLHVVEWVHAPRGLEAPFEEDAASRTKYFTGRLEKLAKDSVPAAYRGDLVVQTGRAGWQVIKTALKQQADLIVVATHGRTGLRRMILGSTAEWLVRRSKCPVLTVHPSDKHSTPGPRVRSLRRAITRILVPVDFSERSESTVKFAGYLAGTLGARVGLLHVVTPLPRNSTRFRVQIRQYDRDIKAQALRQLDGLAGLLPKGIKCEQLLQQDLPDRGILEAAKGWRANLILLPTRGVDHTKFFTLGGTAELVVRRAECPVLTYGPEFKP